ncbi:MAG: Ig domain-containing protein [Gemmatimonadaceae bacterium]
MPKYLVILGALLAACSGGGDGPVPVSRVEVSAPTLNLVVGQSTQLTAAAKDQSGNTLSGRAFSYTSDAAGIASVSGGGLVTAVAPGQVRIRVTSEGKEGSVLITVSPVPVASVTVTPQSPTILAGQTVQLQATVKDAAGNTLTRPVTWSSSDATIASVDVNTGLVTGVAAGAATITANSEGVTGSSQVTVNPPPNAPQITGVTPALLLPGATGVTITGTNFSSTPVSNLVSIDGVTATVTAASPTQLTISLPAAGFACEATHNATVSVTVNGVAGTKPHPLQVARQIALVAGQTDLVLNPAQVRCNELSQTGGRYTVSVFNTSTTIGGAAAFQFRGAAATALAAASITMPPAVTNRQGMPLATVGRSSGQLSPDANLAERRELRRQASVHYKLMEQNRDILKRTASPLSLLRQARQARTSSSQGLALSTTGASSMPVSGNVGDTSSVKVPKIRTTNFCSNDTTVRARTVYSGTRSIIVEDVNNPLAGAMDSYFQALGDEFDNVMFPILTANFGNPLALDAQLDNNGKLIMLFSNVVNGFGGLAGFVVSCDFFPTSTFSASNVGEMFYAFAPNNSQSGFPQGLPNGEFTKDNWRRVIRSTIIHEAKHITSFAERISRSAPSFEEIWLEEGTAFHAEELWARGVYGAAWKGNTGYQTSLYCDVRPTFPECAGRPYVMFDHFAFMYDYLSSNETLSPLSVAGQGDFTFYGSTWSLVRWTIDQYASSDAAFLQALTQEATRIGVGNLEARAGHTFSEILGFWSLANALDDSPGFAPGRAELTQPSWNTRDIFARMNQDFPGTGGFPRVFPLQPRQASFGSFSIDVPSLRSGTASYFEITGSQQSKQLIEVRSQGGGDPPTTLRVGIVRVQ